jgi:hypothetical protein
LPSEDEVLDLLYGLPLSDFTARRNALVKELRASGEKELASVVQKAAKPTVPAWAVNQLARGETSSLHQLLDLQERMAGVDSASELRRLSSERRALVNELTHDAERLLAEAGHAASSSTRHQISQTLLAGATEDERRLLVRGRLTRELSSTGLEQTWDLGGFGDAEGGEAEPPAEREHDAAARRHAETITKKAREAQREAEHLAMAAEEARVLADRAEKKAKQAAERARAAEAEASKARQSAGLAD